MESPASALACQAVGGVDSMGQANVVTSPLVSGSAVVAPPDNPSLVGAGMVGPEQEESGRLSDVVSSGTFTTMTTTMIY